MTCQQNLAVGSLFEEVDDAGDSSYHWILCIHPMHPSPGAEPSPHIVPDGKLTSTAASTQTGKRICWDV